MDKETLNCIAIIIQIITGVVTSSFLIHVFVNRGEIRQSIKARHLDALLHVNDLIGNQKASKNREWVYQDLKKVSWPLSTADKDTLLDICRDFDHIGYLCSRELVDIDLVVERYNRNIVDMWNRLERFVIELRKETNDDDYYREFELLALEARKKQKELERKH